MRAMRCCAEKTTWYGGSPVRYRVGAVCGRDLYNNQLVGTIPAAIWNLPSLLHVCVPSSQRCFTCAMLMRSVVAEI